MEFPRNTLVEAFSSIGTFRVENEVFDLLALVSGIFRPANCQQNETSLFEMELVEEWSSVVPKKPVLTNRIRDGNGLKCEPRLPPTWYRFLNQKENKPALPIMRRALKLWLKYTPIGERRPFVFNERTLGSSEDTPDWIQAQKDLFFLPLNGSTYFRQWSTLRWRSLGRTPVLQQLLWVSQSGFLRYACWSAPWRENAINALSRTYWS